MKKLFVVSAILIAVDFFSFENYAQCSDAGICQLGGHQLEDESESIFDVSASYKYGYSGKEDDVQFHSFQLNGNYNLFSKTSIQFLLPYNIQSGPDGNVNGIGDLILSMKQILFSDQASAFEASIGAKLATGDDNQDNLPQVYQSGLGSNDLLFGVNYTYGKLIVGAGYQVAGGRNENVYRLERGDDLLLRAGYNFQLDEFSIIPQLLFIKRLAESTVLDTTSVQESFIEVDNSDQSQLNLLMLANYQVDENYSLFLDFAIPFIKREVNVDGLTRAFSASVGVKFSFK